MALVLDTRLYYPLNTSKRGSFRLLTLQPRGSADEVICTLSHDTWEDGTRYEALSYVWGYPTLNRRTISLNGRPFSITESLYTALRDLRIWREPRIIWADAICINQDDDVERAEQVRYMGEIYENAERVIVWLGEADQHSDDAIFFANSLISNIGLNLETITQILDLNGDDKVLELLDMPLFNEYFQKPYLHLWASVIRVARHPWWTRAG